MRKIVFIAAGGFAGAVLRYMLEASGAVPLSTLIVNTSGCFLLAFILTEAFELFGKDSDIKPGIAAGLLGAFTTFSTLCREIAGLIYAGSYAGAALYATAAIITGVAAAYFGAVSARGIATLIIRSRMKSDTSGESGD